ncbi:MAG: DNA-binding protein [Verrucomicrobia bacterium]|nr:MAG: DNA-binding protein [Verrucomicrobiota bacterium]
MKYNKPALTFEQQAEQLIGRGLIADKEQLVQRLEATSYFRLSGYLYPFRARGSDKFQSGTTLESVWRLCLFDQRLRTLLIDAIEAIEVFTRTQLAYHFAHLHGPFGYHNPKCLPQLRPDAFLKWQRKLDDQVDRCLRSKEEFHVHFFNRYGDEHSRPPIWCLIELMDFGSMLTFYRGIDYRIKQRIADKVGIPDRVFGSWLLSLNTVRNRCAHHSRLWNWTLGNPVLLPTQRKYPEWHSPGFPNNQIGIILVLCRHLLESISPANRWTERLFQHFAEFPEISVREMGLPESWQQHPLWKS